MTTYAFPSVTPNTSNIELISNTSRFVSPISGAIQTIDRGGERWMISLQYRNLQGANLGTMLAFFTKLNGQQHRFTLHNHAENNQGSFGGTPLVAGASQTGTSLNIDGCSFNITNWIKGGDWFGVGGALKLATADANSDGAGLLTLSFGPRILTAPANNDPITTTVGTGVFLLANNGVKWSNRPGGFSDLSITALEDIAA